MADEKANDKEKKDEHKLQPVEAVTKQHQMKMGGKTLKYTSTAGAMSLKDDKDEIEANIYYWAYTLDGVKDVSERPLCFVFNGGPGSASVWLHLGALGPKRVIMEDEGWMPKPPYKLEDNPNTWLDKTDLVFIDPVGTGFSRGANPDKNSEKYWNFEGDFKSVAEVIRLYLVHNNRWTSPLFLAGESYGTTRSAGVSKVLMQKGIGLNGIALISTVLDFQTLRFAFNNQLPYYLYVPTYAVTGWYHGKLADELQAKSIEDLLAEVEDWTINTYAIAIAKGDAMTDDEKQDIAEKLAYYTGLSETYIKQNKLKINIMRFCKELLRDEGRTVGRLDSRFKGIDTDNAGETFEFDPSMVAIIPPYTAMMNHYAREQLGLETDIEYETLSYKVFQGWKHEEGKYPDTSNDLRETISKNPYMKIFVAQGYYDLATPYFAWLYTYNHMSLDDEVRDNFVTKYYEAGHMMYLHKGELAQLKADADEFFDDAV